MEFLLEKILPIVASLLAGGGLTWLFAFRQRVSRLRNELSQTDFESFQSVTTKYVSQLSELTERIEKLEDNRADLLRRLADCEGRNKIVQPSNLVKK